MKTKNSVFSHILCCIFSVGFTTIISAVLFYKKIFENQGQNNTLILFSAAAILSLLIAIVFSFISDHAAHDLTIVGIVPMLYIASVTLFYKFELPATMYQYMYVIFSAFLVMSLFCIFTALNDMNHRKLLRFIKRNRVFLIFMIVIIVIRIPHLGMLPRWDSGEYYARFTNALTTYQYDNFNGFLTAFALCKHPTIAFSIVYSILELIAPGHIYGVTITSLILTVIAMICVYRIILHMINGISHSIAAVCTFLLSMAPLIFSSSSYFAPDYALALFTIFAIYGYVFKRPLIAAFASLLCFQTKETGLVLIGGLVLGTFLQHFANRKRKPFLKAVFTDSRLYFTLVSTIIQLMYNFHIGGISNWTQTDGEAPGLTWNSAGTNCLGFNPAYVWTRFKQIFILNFNWIPTLVIIICIIILIIFRIKNRGIHSMVDSKRCKNSTNSIFLLVGVFIANTSFSCLYITVAMARYNAVSDAILYLFSFFFISLILERVFYRYEYQFKKTFLIASGVFSILLALQCFFTIDPFTRMSFTKLDTVNSSIYYTGLKDTTIEYYGDYLIYNTQFTYIDRAYDAMLEDTGYDPETYDLVLPHYIDSFISGNSSIYYLNWDYKTKSRVFYTSPTTVQLPGYMVCNDVANNIASGGTMHDTAILLSNPYWGLDMDDYIAFLSDYYVIGEKQTAKTLQGSIEYYVMQLR